MMEDIQITHEGLIVTLRRSKTDQEGQTITTDRVYKSVAGS
jgi:hypothetical protein